MLADLPELGVGVVYSSGLEPLLEAGGHLIDVIEIEPQTFWFKSPSPGAPYIVNDAVVERLNAYPQPKIVHGVGFPVGGSAPLDIQHIRPFVESIVAIDAPWASEHLSFNCVECAEARFNTGFLLPPLQTAAGATMAAEKIRRLTSQLPVPFAFETGVNYLRPRPGEMSDGAFFAAVAEQADCGILLDLHNLWCNELNGRQRVLDVLAELPLDRVCEVHLAGGKAFQGYWLDAHSDVVPRPLMEIAAEAISCLPNLKALIFEIMADHVAAKNLKIEDLLQQVRQLRALWSQRSERVGTTRPLRKEPLPSSTKEGLPSPSEWEHALGRLVIGRAPDRPLSARLAEDPGVEILRHLVTAMRAGMVVDTLRLTYRLLTLQLGESGVHELLQDFWNTAPPEPFASEEARNFATYLQARSLDIPHLYEVLEFELASQRAIIEGSPQTVDFCCDPLPLLQALGEGHMPDSLTQGVFELVIDTHSHEDVANQAEQAE